MNYIVVLEHMFELIVNKQKEREKNVCLSVKLSVDQKWRRRKLRNIGTKNRCKDIKTNGCKAFFDGSPVFLGLKLIENVFFCRLNTNVIAQLAKYQPLNGFCGIETLQLYAVFGFCFLFGLFKKEGTNFTSSKRFLSLILYLVCQSTYKNDGIDW